MVTQENAFNYDKGVLAEILEPIMGKGLIPADLETWKPRRRAIVPAFHKAWLEKMVAMFGACTQETIRSLDSLTADGQVPSLCPCIKSTLVMSCAAYSIFLAARPVLNIGRKELRCQIALETGHFS